MKKTIWSLLFVLPLIALGCGGSSSDTTPASTTYTVSGDISVQIGALDGVTVTLALAGADPQTATTDSDGAFSLTGVEAGDYTLTPSKTDFTFTPTSLAVTVSTANVTDNDFVAAIDETTFKIAFNTNDDLAGTDVLTMNLDGSERLPLTDNGTSWIPRFSSDKTKVLYNSGFDSVYVVNADGTGTATEITPDGAAPGEPSFASDDSVVLFADTTDTGYEIVNAPVAGSLVVTPLTTLTGDNWGAVVFPSGDEFVFSSKPTGLTRYTVMKMSVIDGTPTDLTPNETTTATYMAVSGDGTKIAYVGGYDGGFSDVFLMDADGSNITNISNDETHINAYPSVSYDGTKVVFGGTRDTGASEIYIADADGLTVTRLTATTTDNIAHTNYRPQFLRDGRILFVSERDSLKQIYVMNADGSEPTQVSDGTTNDNQGNSSTWDKPSF